MSPGKGCKRGIRNRTEQSSRHE